MRHKKIVVHNFDDYMAAFNGKSYVLDGVHGHFKVAPVTRGDYYGGGHEMKITHEPSARGKQSEAYRRLKRQLGDDYSSDLTWSEHLGEIGHKLGIEYKGE